METGGGSLWIERTAEARDELRDPSLFWRSCRLSASSLPDGQAHSRWLRVQPAQRGRVSSHFLRRIRPAPTCQSLVTAVLFVGLTLQTSGFGTKFGGR